MICPLKYSAGQRPGLSKEEKPLKEQIVSYACSKLPEALKIVAQKEFVIQKRKQIFKVNENQAILLIIQYFFSLEMEVQKFDI